LLLVVVVVGVVHLGCPAVVVLVDIAQHLDFP
jgi:hypothetical protein